MRVAHLLRKYRPEEWGGTETAVHRLIDGLRAHGVESSVYAPRLEPGAITHSDPLASAGASVRRYRATAPVWGISAEQRKQLVAVGGNLLSLDLPFKLLREPGLSVIHTHATNRIGGAGLAAARRRRVPLVVTIHGGALDLPAAVRESLSKPLQGGFEWGKIFGYVLQSRRVLELADAVLTCNPREAELLREKYPEQKILVQPHSVPASLFAQDKKEAARKAFPEIGEGPLVLCAGRIDPVKNQLWLVQQMPAVLKAHPQARLVLAGACTDEAYGKALKKEIRNLGLESVVVRAGSLPPGDERLLGLYQSASAVAVPSLSETFGIVILEAWAAGVPVISTRTSGAASLIEHEKNGLFFNAEEPESFQEAIGRLLDSRPFAKMLAEAGRGKARAEFSSEAVAGRVKDLYEELVLKKGRR